MRRDRFVLHARLLVMLALGLAAPAALADQGQCEADCATASSLELQSCMERCPEARDPTKASSFQACALRCKDKFERVMNTCSERCPNKNAKDIPGQKKKKKKGSEQ